MAVGKLYAKVMGLTAILALSLDSLALAVVKHSHERIELDWASMRVRYFGQAGASNLAGDSYGEAKDRALREGLSYLVRTFPDMYAKKVGREPTDADRDMAHRIASSTFISEAEYFADGGVRVRLESNLARAMSAEQYSFRRDTVRDLPRAHSALVIRLKTAASPRPTYEVAARSSGEGLFGVADVAREEFERNLMGRWFAGERSREYRNFVGQSPVVLEAELDASGRLLVSEQEWHTIRQENPGLLESARIAIVVPHP